jgi:hypothetical protein
MLLAASLSAACVFEHPVDVTLDYDPTFSAAVSAFALTIHRTDACPRIDTYTLDAHATSLVHSQFFTGMEGEPVGNVDPGRYAFVGLGLTDECVVILGGCQLEELDENELTAGDPIHVEIGMPFTTAWVGSLCGSGRRCEAGVCVEAP